MKEHRRLTNNMEQYVFSLKEHGLDFDINVTVLINGSEALLIDVGYPEHGEAVKMALDKRGIKVTDIICSHYHPDHVAGAHVFTDAKILSSKDYEINYKNCSEKWDVETAYRKADKTFYSGEEMTYGDFKLKIFDTPGHSVCGISVVINDTYIHVGDLIMADAHGKDALPMVCPDGGIHEHIESLEWLKKQGDKKLILAHGNLIENQEKILKTIKIREDYLSSLIEAYERWHDESYEASKLEYWACEKWHKGNMRIAKKLVL